MGRARDYSVKLKLKYRLRLVFCQRSCGEAVTISVLFSMRFVEVR